jgi:uncharacterized protein (DUF736 family)
MRIGNLVAVDGGFTGRLQTIALDINLVLVPVEKSGGINPPDFRVVIGEGDSARDIGAGWSHVGKKVGAYVSVQFDDPMFARPVRAKLFHDDNGGHTLFWNRQPKRPVTI